MSSWPWHWMKLKTFCHWIDLVALPWNNGDRQPSTRMLGGRVEGCKLPMFIPWFCTCIFGVTGGAGFQTSIGILRELVGAGWWCISLVNRGARRRKKNIQNPRLWAESKCGFHSYLLSANFSSRRTTRRWRRRVMCKRCWKFCKGC